MRTTTRSRSARRHRRAEAENEDRWLLTYADMITLLMALFMVLFSISSLNVSKYESLKLSLAEAFSGRVLPGGRALQQSGNQDAPNQPTGHEPAVSLPIATPEGDAGPGRYNEREDEDFRRVQRRVEAYASDSGLGNQIETEIARRGLIIRLLTDRVLFDSGEAVLRSAAFPLLHRIAGLIHEEARHPVMVEGHTDSVPIRSSQYPSNWELSTARAASVVRFFIADGLRPTRLGAAGYAALRPLQTNASEPGRSRNRRVEIVLLRGRPPGFQGGDAR